jgi:hypothetical protein
MKKLIALLLFGGLMTSTVAFGDQANPDLPASATPAPQKRASIHPRRTPATTAPVAQSPTPAPAPASAPAKATSPSSSNLDFSGEVVEGVNRQPLDSLNATSEQNAAKNKVFLYKKRQELTDENNNSVRDLLRGDY